MCAAAVAYFPRTLGSQTGGLVEKSQRAKEAMSGGRYDEAASLYSDLVRAMPDNAGLRMDLGLALHSSGRYREAIQQFQTAVKRDPALGPAWMMLGLAYQKLGEPKEAIAPLERALGADPSSRVARLELADACLSANRPQEAMGHFNAIVEADPNDAKAWQGLGLSYVALSQRSFSALEKTAPDSVYRDLVLARTLMSRNELYTAFHLYKQALAKAPGLREVHEGLAEAYQATGHPDWAAIEKDRALELPEQDCASHALECDFHAGRFQELLERAKSDPSPDSLFWQTQAYEELSLEAFSHLGQLPATVEIHNLMAEAYRIKGKYDLAARERQEALNLDPQNRQVQKGLAQALWLNRKYDRAQPLLEKLIAQEPESAELNYELGDTLLRSGFAEAAIPLLERAARSSPRNLAAHASLGRAYMRVNQAEQAIPHLKAALSLDEEGSLYYQLAQAYQKAGDAALANQTMQRFEEISSAVRALKPQHVEEFQITPP